MGENRETWPGGYIRTGARGRRVFIIERFVGGRRFHVSTRCSTLTAAMKQLERFETSPDLYHPAGHDSGLRLTAELALEYAKHQVATGCTKEWAKEMGRCLTAWLTVLGTRDLRGLSLHKDIKPALEAWPKRKAQRIKALKGFCRWLRVEKGLLRHSEDPTVDLRVPQPSPERFRRRKVVAPEDVAAVLKVLPQPARDVLHLLTATAWHLSEVRRFVTAGELVERAGGPVLAVLLTRHKSGELTRTPLVFAEHLDTAKRLRAMADLPTRMTFSRQMRAACDEAGVPRFGMGVMRHSVLTWASERGATLGAAAAFAHHHNESTTRRFYVDMAEPVAPIPVLQLA